MLKSYFEDYKYGIAEEEKIRTLLINHFNEDIIKTKERYCKYDYICLASNNKFELKSRRNNKNHYPTTIIPVDKVITNDNLYFIFNFIDKCCYIKYNEDQFKQFNKRIIKTNRWDKNDKPNVHYEIPVDLLVDIN